MRQTYRKFRSQAVETTPCCRKTAACKADWVQGIGCSSRNRHRYIREAARCQTLLIYALQRVQADRERNGSSISTVEDLQEYLQPGEDSAFCILCHAHIQAKDQVKLAICKDAILTNAPCILYIRKVTRSRHKTRGTHVDHAIVVEVVMEQPAHFIV